MQSASKGSEGTQVELLDGNKLISTWHDEIFELPFAVKNPEKASMYMLYTSDAVQVNVNQRIRITTKLAKRSFGFFAELEKVCCFIDNMIINSIKKPHPSLFRNTATLQQPVQSSFESRYTAMRPTWTEFT